MQHNVESRAASSLLVFLTLAVINLAVVQSARAALVYNGGFEVPRLDENSTADIIPVMRGQSLEGWTLDAESTGSNAAIFAPGILLNMPAVEGEQVLALSLACYLDSGVAINRVYQDITTAPGGYYELRFSYTGGNWSESWTEGQHVKAAVHDVASGHALPSTVLKTPANCSIQSSCWAEDIVRFQAISTGTRISFAAFQRECMHLDAVSVHRIAHTYDPIVWLDNRNVYSNGVELRSVEVDPQAEVGGDWAGSGKVRWESPVGSIERVCPYSMGTGASGFTDTVQYSSGSATDASVRDRYFQAPRRITHALRTEHATYYELHDENPSANASCLLPRNGPFAVSLWAYSDEWDSAQGATLLSSDVFELSVDASAACKLDLSDGPLVLALSNYSTSYTSGWHSFIVYWDTQCLSLHIDEAVTNVVCINVTTSDGILAESSSGSLSIGRSTSFPGSTNDKGSTAFNGRIADLGIYSGALWTSEATDAEMMLARMELRLKRELHAPDASSLASDANFAIYEGLMPIVWTLHQRPSEALAGAVAAPPENIGYGGSEVILHNIVASSFDHGAQRQYVEFDGVLPTYMDFPTPFVREGMGVSICGWLNISSFPGGDAVAVTTGDAAIGAFNASASGTALARVWNGTSYTYLYDNEVVMLGEWHHACLVAAGNSATLYRDGRIVDAVELSVFFSPSFPDGFIRVGAGFDNGNTTEVFQGSVSDVRVYDGILSSASISAIYEDSDAHVALSNPDNGWMADIGVDPYISLSPEMMFALTDNDLLTVVELGFAAELSPNSKPTFRFSFKVPTQLLRIGIATVTDSDYRLSEFRLVMFPSRSFHPIVYSNTLADGVEIQWFDLESSLTSDSGDLWALSHMLLETELSTSQFSPVLSELHLDLEHPRTSVLEEGTVGLDIHPSFYASDGAIDSDANQTVEYQIHLNGQLHEISGFTLHLEAAPEDCFVQATVQSVDVLQAAEMVGSPVLDSRPLGWADVVYSVSGSDEASTDYVLHSVDGDIAESGFIMARSLRLRVLYSVDECTGNSKSIMLVPWGHVPSSCDSPPMLCMSVEVHTSTRSPFLSMEPLSFSETDGIPGSPVFAGSPFGNWSSWYVVATEGFGSDSVGTLPSIASEISDVLTGYTYSDDFKATVVPMDDVDESYVFDGERYDHTITPYGLRLESWTVERKLSALQSGASIFIEGTMIREDGPVYARVDLFAHSGRVEASEEIYIGDDEDSQTFSVFVAKLSVSASYTLRIRVVDSVAILANIGVEYLPPASLSAASIQSHVALLVGPTSYQLNSHGVCTQSDPYWAATRFSHSPVLAPETAVGRHSVLSETLSVSQTPDARKCHEYMSVMDVLSFDSDIDTVLYRATWNETTGELAEIDTDYSDLIFGPEDTRLNVFNPHAVVPETIGLLYMAEDAALSSGELTFSAWLKMDQTTSSTPMVLLSIVIRQYAWDEYEPVFSIAVADGVLQMSSLWSDDTVRTVSLAEYEAQWVHVVASVFTSTIAEDDALAAVAINGRHVGIWQFNVVDPVLQRELVGVDLSGVQIGIGAGPTGNGTTGVFDGMMDDIRIFRSRVPYSADCLSSWSFPRFRRSSVDLIASDYNRLLGFLASAVRMERLLVHSPIDLAGYGPSVYWNHYPSACEFAGSTALGDLWQAEWHCTPDDVMALKVLSIVFDLDLPSLNGTGFTAHVLGEGAPCASVEASVDVAADEYTCHANGQDYVGTLASHSISGRKCLPWSGNIPDDGGYSRTFGAGCRWFASGADVNNDAYCYVNVDSTSAVTMEPCPHFSREEIQDCHCSSVPKVVVSDEPLVATELWNSVPGTVQNVSSLSVQDTVHMHPRLLSLHPKEMVLGTSPDHPAPSCEYVFNTAGVTESGMFWISIPDTVAVRGRTGAVEMYCVYDLSAEIETVHQDFHPLATAIENFGFGGGYTLLAEYTAVVPKKMSADTYEFGWAPTVPGAGHVWPCSWFPAPDYELVLVMGEVVDRTRPAAAIRGTNITLCDVITQSDQHEWYNFVNETWEAPAYVEDFLGGSANSSLMNMTGRVYTNGWGFDGASHVNGGCCYDAWNETASPHWQRTFRLFYREYPPTNPSPMSRFPSDQLEVGPHSEPLRLRAEISPVHDWKNIGTYATVALDSSITSSIEVHPPNPAVSLATGIISVPRWWKAASPSQLDEQSAFGDFLWSVGRGDVASLSLASLGAVEDIPLHYDGNNVHVAPGSLLSSYATGLLNYTVVFDTMELNLDEFGFCLIGWDEYGFRTSDMPFQPQIEEDTLFYAHLSLTFAVTPATNVSELNAALQNDSATVTVTALLPVDTCVNITDTLLHSTPPSLDGVNTTLFTGELFANASNAKGLFTPVRQWVVVSSVAFDAPVALEFNSSNSNCSVTVSGIQPTEDDIRTASYDMWSTLTDPIDTAEEVVEGVAESCNMTMNYGSQRVDGILVVQQDAPLEITTELLDAFGNSVPDADAELQVDTVHAVYGTDSETTTYPLVAGAFTFTVNTSVGGTNHTAFVPGTSCAVSIVVESPVYITEPQPFSISTVFGTVLVSSENGSQTIQELVVPREFPLVCVEFDSVNGSTFAEDNYTVAIAESFTSTVPELADKLLVTEFVSNDSPCQWALLPQQFWNISANTSVLPNNATVLDVVMIHAFRPVDAQNYVHKKRDVLLSECCGSEILENSVRFPDHTYIVHEFVSISFTDVGLPVISDGSIHSNISLLTEGDATTFEFVLYDSEGQKSVLNSSDAVFFDIEFVPDMYYDRIEPWITIDSVALNETLPVNATGNRVNITIAAAVVYGETSVAIVCHTSGLLRVALDVNDTYVVERPGYGDAVQPRPELLEIQSEVVSAELRDWVRSNSSMLYKRWIQLTPSASATSSVSVTETSTVSVTSTSTTSSTVSISPSSTSTESSTVSATNSVSSTLSASSSESSTVSATNSISSTLSATSSESSTVSATNSISSTLSATSSESSTVSGTSSVTNSITSTLSSTESSTSTSSSTSSVTSSVTSTSTQTQTVSATSTVTPTISATLSSTRTETASPSSSSTTSATSTTSVSPTSTVTTSVTSTMTVSPSVTDTPDLTGAIITGDIIREIEYDPYWSPQYYPMKLTLEGVIDDESDACSVLTFMSYLVDGRSVWTDIYNETVLADPVDISHGADFSVDIWSPGLADTLVDGTILTQLNLSIIVQNCNGLNSSLYVIDPWTGIHIDNSAPIELGSVTPRVLDVFSYPTSRQQTDYVAFNASAYPILVAMSHADSHSGIGSFHVQFYVEGGNSTSPFAVMLHEQEFTSWELDAVLTSPQYVYFSLAIPASHVETVQQRFMVGNDTRIFVRVSHRNGAGITTAMAGSGEPINSAGVVVDRAGPVRADAYESANVYADVLTLQQGEDQTYNGTMYISDDSLTSGTLGIEYSWLQSAFSDDLSGVGRYVVRVRIAASPIEVANDTVEHFLTITDLSQSTVRAFVSFNSALLRFRAPSAVFSEATVYAVDRMGWWSPLGVEATRIVLDRTVPQLSDAHVLRSSASTVCSIARVRNDSSSVTVRPVHSASDFDTYAAQRDFTIFEALNVSVDLSALFVEKESRLRRITVSLVELPCSTDGARSNPWSTVYTGCYTSQAEIAVLKQIPGSRNVIDIPAMRNEGIVDVVFSNVSYLVQHSAVGRCGNAVNFAVRIEVRSMGRDVSASVLTPVQLVLDHTRPVISNGGSVEFFPAISTATGRFASAMASHTVSKYTDDRHTALLHMLNDEDYLARDVSAIVRWDVGFSIVAPDVSDASYTDTPIQTLFRTNYNDVWPSSGATPTVWYSLWKEIDVNGSVTFSVERDNVQTSDVSVVVDLTDLEDGSSLIAFNETGYESGDLALDVDVDAIFGSRACGSILRTYVRVYDVVGQSSDVFELEPYLIRHVPDDAEEDLLYSIDSLWCYQMEQVGPLVSNLNGLVPVDYNLRDSEFSCERPQCYMSAESDPDNSVLVNTTIVEVDGRRIPRCFIVPQVELVLVLGVANDTRVFQMRLECETSYAVASSNDSSNGTAVAPRFVEMDSLRDTFFFESLLGVFVWDRFSNESGDTARMAIALTRQPTSNVTVPIRSSDPLKSGRPRVSSLVFTPQNWFKLQTVWVEGLRDDTREGNWTYEIKVGPTISPGNRIFHNSRAVTVELTNINVLYPEIIEIVPSLSAIGGGNAVTIFGKHFFDGLQIKMNVFNNATGETFTTVLNATVQILPSNWLQQRLSRGDPIISGNGVISTAEMSQAFGVQSTRHLSSGLLPTMVGVGAPHLNTIPQTRFTTSNATTNVTLDPSSPFRALIFEAPPQSDVGYSQFDLNNANGHGDSIGQMYFTDQCPFEGYYYRTGRCFECPETAVCPGGARIWPLPGYWNMEEGDWNVQRCDPEWRCLGGRDSECAEGFGGVTCGECAEGYFSQGELCLKCNGTESIMFMVLYIVLIALLYVYAVMMRSDEVFDLTVELWFTLQLIRAVGQMVDGNIPQFVQDFLSRLSFVTFDIEFIKPGCGLGDTSFEFAFYANLVLMLMLVIPVFIVFPILIRIEDRRLRRKFQAEEEDTAPENPLKVEEQPVKAKVNGSRIVPVTVGADGDVPASPRTPNIGVEALLTMDDMLVDPVRVEREVAHEANRQRKFFEKNFYRRRFHRMLLILFLMCFLALLTRALESVNCISLDDIEGVESDIDPGNTGDDDPSAEEEEASSASLVLQASPSVECFKGPHTIMFLFGLPILLVTLGSIMYFFYHIYRNRFQLHKLRVQFGTLFEAYKPRYFYFGSLALIVEALIVIYYIVLWKDDVMRFCLLMLTLGGLGVFVLRLRPFELTEENDYYLSILVIGAMESVMNFIGAVGSGEAIDSILQAMSFMFVTMIFVVLFMFARVIRAIYGMKWIDVWTCGIRNRKWYRKYIHDNTRARSSKIAHYDESEVPAEDKQLKVKLVRTVAGEGRGQPSSSASDDSSDTFKNVLPGGDAAHPKDPKITVPDDGATIPDLRQLLDFTRWNEGRSLHGSFTIQSHGNLYRAGDSASSSMQDSESVTDSSPPENDILSADANDPMKVVVHGEPVDDMNDMESETHMLHQLRDQPGIASDAAGDTQGSLVEDSSLPIHAPSVPRSEPRSESPRFRRVTSNVRMMSSFVTQLAQSRGLSAHVPRSLPNQRAPNRLPPLGVEATSPPKSLMDVDEGLRVQVRADADLDSVERIPQPPAKRPEDGEETPQRRGRRLVGLSTRALPPLFSLLEAGAVGARTANDDDIFRAEDTFDVDHSVVFYEYLDVSKELRLDASNAADGLFYEQLHSLADIGMRIRRLPNEYPVRKTAVQDLHAKLQAGEGARALLEPLATADLAVASDDACLTVLCILRDLYTQWRRRFVACSDSHEQPVNGDLPQWILIAVKAGKNVMRRLAA